MTTIQSKPDGRRAGASTLAGSIEWMIDRRAMVRAKPELFPESRSRRPVALRVVWDQASEARAELVDPATDRVHAVPLGTVEVRASESPPVSHLEIRSPGGVVLSATFRTDGASARLVYARTTLLGELKIPGGRYQAPTLGA